LEYDLLGPHILNLRLGHPARQIIGCVGIHSTKFGLGDGLRISTGKETLLLSRMLLTTLVLIPKLVFSGIDPKTF